MKILSLRSMQARDGADAGTDGSADGLTSVHEELWSGCMVRDAVRLRPPTYSYVDMLEHLSDGVQVDIVVPRNQSRRRRKRVARANRRGNNRPASRSNHDGQD